MERLASMAANSALQVDEAKAELAQARKEKAELDVHNKKLKALLAKARQQMTEQKQSKDQMPDGFIAEDVVRRTRGPDGQTWCLIAKRQRTEPSSFEWREESAVLSWFSEDDDAKKRAELRFAPLIEEEVRIVVPFLFPLRRICRQLTASQLNERHTRNVREVEAKLAIAQQETEAINERFAQYMRRAELALNMAEQPREADGLSERLKEELARLSRCVCGHRSTFSFFFFFKKKCLKLKSDAYVDDDAAGIGMCIFCESRSSE